MSRQLWLGMLWLLGASVAPAQVKTPAQETAFAPRPITLRGGETIVNAAWERERQTGRRPDCSHLVHAIYIRAGFPYTYLRSSDLYRGADEFQRVTDPQPGDLVVWKGHVGIVVYPAQRIFFSAMRSGLGIDSYDAPYWKRRGHPYFYRYMKPNGLSQPTLVLTDQHQQ